LRFAVAGALLFVGASRWAPAPHAAQVPRLAAAGDDEDALLFEVALAAELDRTDSLVRDRLRTLARFLALAPDTAGDADLEHEARALGLVRSDPIIRRHLVDLMRLAAATLPPAALPDEGALRAAYAAHLDAYALPARVRLTHVYLSRDRRGADLERDAAALATMLRQRGLEAARGLGDGFSRGATIGPATAADLARVFGARFADAVAVLPAGQWSAPIASPYGLHLVWIEARLPAASPPYEAVRNQVLHAWLRERRADQLSAALASLRRDPPSGGAPASMPATAR
jgi:hypothetical protein